jgi:hypothetical protein
MKRQRPTRNMDDSSNTPSVVIEAKEDLVRKGHAVEKLKHYFNYIRHILIVAL